MQTETEVPQDRTIRDSLEEITRTIRCTLLSNPYCEVLIKRHDGIVTVAKTIKDRFDLSTQLDKKVPMALDE